MKVRGRRRCRDCGTRWSYYETGSVECPDCGSIRSVGVDDERALHTDAPVELDLREARAGIDERPPDDVAADAGAAAREYVAARGFVHGGTLRDLDETFLAAAELRYAADELRRGLDGSEEAERYFLALLEDAPEGERPDEVPASMWAARGLGVADAVGAYRRDLRAWLEEHPDPAAADALGTLREHEKRVAALDGDVEPATAECLLTAAREVGEYLRGGDEGALARAGDRLARLG